MMKYISCRSCLNTQKQKSSLIYNNKFTYIYDITLFKVVEIQKYLFFAFAFE